MGKKGSAADKLNQVGIEAICARIEEGESYREIAASLDIGASTLCAWLNSPEHAERSARAREMSAEAWLDKGLDAVSSALPKDGGIDASAARAYAQECARRAAIRNPQYREKRDVELSGSLDVAGEIGRARKRSGR